MHRKSMRGNEGDDSSVSGLSSVSKAKGSKSVISATTTGATALPETLQYW